MWCQVQCVTCVLTEFSKFTTYMYSYSNSPFGDGAQGFGPWRCWLTPARRLPRCELPGSYTLNLAHGHGGHGEGSFGASILGRFSRASAGSWGPLAKRDEGDFRGPRRRTGTLLRLPSLPYQQGGESTRRNGCQEPRPAQSSFSLFLN